MSNADLYSRAEELARPDGVFQFKADVARWEILNRYGGVYVDTDTTCLRPLGGLLIGRRMIAGWEVDDEWIANGVLAATPRHTVTREIIARLPALASEHGGKSVPTTKLTGPQALTPILRDRKNVTVFPSSYFFPTSWNNPTASDSGHFPGSYTVHHWNHQREIRGLPAPDTGRPTGDRQTVRPTAHRHERRQGAH